MLFVTTNKALQLLTLQLTAKISYHHLPDDIGHIEGWLRGTFRIESLILDDQFY